ncbi:MAG: redoxin domain-containing protein [Planctomycetes bacterium]|nr:redoxin domain-containing protein [Planctomycetota bacterium]
MLIPITLLLLGATPPPAVAPVAAPTVAVAWTAPVRVDSYGDLMSAYSQAKADRRAAIKAAGSAKERRELRAKRPATDFLPRFEALGESGDVRGFTWMLDEAKRLGIGKSDRLAHLLDVYGRIVMAPADSKHFAEAMQRIGEEKKLDASQRVSLLKRVLGREDAAGEGRCTAQLFAGSLLFKSDVASDQAMGEQILKELVASESCSNQVKAAEQALLGVSIEVGGTAPDFEGTTIDGKTFNLSDYRGKVVLLDFFGFW